MVRNECIDNGVVTNVSGIAGCIVKDAAMDNAIVLADTCRATCAQRLFTRRTRASARNTQKASDYA
jgi:hypothetical protein